MISGLNQELELLGRVFHFQTELSDQDGLSIRTEVFVGGKVVATREVQVADLEGVAMGDEESIRARMKEQHSQTMVTFAARARRYQDRSGAILVKPPPPPPKPVEEEPPPPPEPPPETVRQPLPPPSIEHSPGAIVALRLRRFFTELRVRLGNDHLTPTGSPPNDLDGRIEQAADAFHWMSESPVFSEIRIDEQVQCHLLREQIEEWLLGTRDRLVGGHIWVEIALFTSYLNEVNARGDLLDFDQRMLLWAIGEVQARGMEDDVLEQLRLLYGRHPRLDKLLDAPGDTGDGIWTAHLRGVLSLI